MAWLASRRHRSVIGAYYYLRNRLPDVFGEDREGGWLRMGVGSNMQG